MTTTRASVRQLIANAGGRMRAAGIDSPRVDAELLMAHLLTATPGYGDVSRSSLLFLSNEQLPADVIDSYEKLIDRRVKREPLQHIMGTAPFAGVDLEVGPGCFIPRPETELICELSTTKIRKAVQARAQRDKDSAGLPFVVVDLCSGPGTLALGLARAVADAVLTQVSRLEVSPDSTTPHDAVPNVIIVGVELQRSALDYAQRNVEKFLQSWQQEASEAGIPPHLARRLHVEVIPGDVTEPAVVGAIHEVATTELTRMSGPGADAKAAHELAETHFADVVVANPPYVPESTEVSPEVRADPHEAVFAGADGMEVIRAMMPQIVTLAAPYAFIAVEHDDSTAHEVVQEFTQAGFEEVKSRRDLAGRDRFVTGFAPADYHVSL